MAPKTITLDLTALDGNAFNILIAFAQQARKEGWTAEEIRVVREEAMKGDYNHLLQTIMAHTKV